MKKDLCRCTNFFAQQHCRGWTSPPPPPKNVKEACAHSEELMSIFDGHIVVTDGQGGFPIDPRASLTRIGAGSNPNDIRDTRSKLLRTAAGPLRLDLCDALASVAHQPQLKTLIDALSVVLAQPPIKRSAKVQAALIWGARNGKNVQSGKLNFEKMEQLDMTHGATEFVFFLVFFTLDKTIMELTSYFG